MDNEVGGLAGFCQVLRWDLWFPLDASVYWEKSRDNCHFHGRQLTDVDDAVGFTNHQLLSYRHLFIQKILNFKNSQSMPPSHLNKQMKHSKVSVNSFVIVESFFQILQAWSGNWPLVTRWFSMNVWSVCDWQAVVSCAYSFACQYWDKIWLNRVAICRLDVGYCAKSQKSQM